MSTTFKPQSGEYLCECDRCTGWFYHSEMRHEWTGFLVCNKCWNPRDPADFLTVPPENIAPEEPRPKTLRVPTTIAGIAIASANTADGTFSTNDYAQAYVDNDSIFPSIIKNTY